MHSYLCLHGMPSKEKRLCCVLSQMLRLIECRGLTQILKFVAETQVEMQVGCIEFMDEAPGLKIKFKKFLHCAGPDCAHVCHINFFLRFWKQYQTERMKIARTFKSSLGLSSCLSCLVLLPFVILSPKKVPLLCSAEQLLRGYLFKNLAHRAADMWQAQNLNIPLFTTGCRRVCGSILRQVYPNL